MKKLPRLPMRPDREPGVEPEIWHPSWNCFCCEDRGLVNPRLAALVIEGFDAGQDKFPRCQNYGCDAGSHYDGAALTPSVDYRLTPDICAELDRLERQNWRDTVQAKQQSLKIDVSDIGFNLRNRSRTPEEEMEAIQKHQEVLARMNRE